VWWVHFRRLVRQLQREGRHHMEVKAFLSEHIVVTVQADGHRHKIFQLMFGKDGSMYASFPYFAHTNGLLAEVTVHGPPGSVSQIDLANTGKVASHLVKYSHHPDGEAHFSQHGKVFTAIRRRSVPLNEQDGHLFTIFIQGLRAYESVGTTKERKTSNKRTTLTFEVRDRFPKAIRIIGRWYWIEDLHVDPRPPTFGPQVDAVEADGIGHKAFIVGNPHDKKHVLVLTCIPQPPIGPDRELMMFLGGFDPPSTIANPRKPTSFLSFLYPPDNFEDLKQRLGCIDYAPVLPVLRSQPDASSK
jgi:hypothetical protein